MPIAQVKIRWTGFAGAPGTTTLNFEQPVATVEATTPIIDAADDFALAIAGALSSSTTVQVDPTVEWFNEATGVLEAVTAVDPIPAPHTGISGATGPLPSGAVITWQTAGINRGKKVRGRTFVVPMAAAAYQSDGTLTSGIQAALSSAAVALIGAEDAGFSIWSRPRAGAGGAAFLADTARVPDMAAVLRSRRD